MIRLRYDTTIGGIRYGRGSLLQLDPAQEAELLMRGDADTETGIYSRDASGKIIGLQGDNGKAIGLQVHPFYHFHGFAGYQVAGDGKFIDLSGINHGLRGAGLSDSQMFSVAGYISTVDPTSLAPDSVIRIPCINFDYSGGEKLIVWWFGKATSEASGAYLLGDGRSTSLRGWAAMATSTQKLQIVVSGATQGYSGSTASAVFDGNLHDFGFVLDGQAKQYAMWVDGTVDPLFLMSGYIPYSQGNDFDTKTSATVNIGSASPAPGDATAGLSTTTRALVILRLPAAYPVPTIATVTGVFRQLRANPGKLILGGIL